MLMYENKDQKCECWKCELELKCVYREKNQRLSKADGGLGKCAKLPENNGQLSDKRPVRKEAIL